MIGEFTYGLDFDSPGYLWFLLVIPLLWWTGRLKAMGLGRQIVAFTIRAVIVTAIVVAMAEPQFVRRSDRLAVVYLLDRSLSISPAEGAKAIDFINHTRKLSRDRGRGDLAGVIVFGGDAAVELPPLEEDVPILNIETTVDSDHTNLAAGLRLAKACFPPDCAKRLVVLSDGNENLGSALEEARSMVDAEIGIDVVSLRHPEQADVAVEKVSAPAEVRSGAPFEVRAVVNHKPGTVSRESVHGTLRVVRRMSGHEQVVAEEPVEIPPGRKVFSFRQEVESPDFYTYDVQFVPDSAAADSISQNDRASAFTHVHGPGRVLLIEDFENPGEFQHLIERLQQATIDVEVLPSNNSFATLADLQRYDCVILANVPRTSGGSAEDLAQFSDDQIEMLVRNTQELGCGLIMLGGANSFGAGGWRNTPLEAAMPVDFQVKNAKVAPQGALMLVIDSSGSMEGVKIEMCKSAAIAAAKVMGERDYVGIVAFDSSPRMVVPLQRVGSRAKSAYRISQISAGGGTNMLPAMQSGYQALQKVDAAVKHMIVLTDGQTEGSGFEALTAQMRKRDITTTSVAIGLGAESLLMRRIANEGGGKFYEVTNPRAIPRIFMKEAMRVSRPLVYENPSGINVALNHPHEVLSGIAAPFPSITGYVLTTAKDNPLVELPWEVSQPGPESHPLLATWTYGLGRSVALTTDAGNRWARSWSAWESYDKLFSQIVRWTMRPTANDGRFTLAADVRDGRLRVVLNALQDDDRHLNYLVPVGRVIDPQLKSRDLKMEQVAPGRYVAECAADLAGNYFVSVLPGPSTAPLRTGINVSSSPEFQQDYAENVALLSALAACAPLGGSTGRVIDLAQPVGSVPEDNLFRRDLPRPSSRQACWHLLVLGAGCLFFVDVLNRRVVLSSSIAACTAAILSLLPAKSSVSAASESIDRLKRRKQQVNQQLEQDHASARWEGPEATEDVLSEKSPAEAVRSIEMDQRLTLESDEPQDDSYTGRLLKAKKKIWEEREN